MSIMEILHSKGIIQKHQKDLYYFDYNKNGKPDEDEVKIEDDNKNGKIDLPEVLEQVVNHVEHLPTIISVQNIINDPKTDEDAAILKQVHTIYGARLLRRRSRMVAYDFHYKIDQFKLLERERKKAVSTLDSARLKKINEDLKTLSVHKLDTATSIVIGNNTLKIPAGAYLIYDAQKQIAFIGNPEEKELTLVINKKKYSISSGGFELSSRGSLRSFSHTWYAGYFSMAIRGRQVKLSDTFFGPVMFYPNGNPMNGSIVTNNWVKFFVGKKLLKFYRHNEFAPVDMTFFPSGRVHSGMNEEGMFSVGGKSILFPRGYKTFSESGELQEFHLKYSGNGDEEPFVVINNKKYSKGRIDSSGRVQVPTDDE